MYAPQPTPEAISALADKVIRAVACGHNHTLALDTQQAAYTWGARAAPAETNHLSWVLVVGMVYPCMQPAHVRELDCGTCTRFRLTRHVLMHVLEGPHRSSSLPDTEVWEGDLGMERALNVCLRMRRRRRVRAAGAQRAEGRVHAQAGRHPARPHARRPRLSSARPA